MVWFRVDDGLAFHAKAVRAGNAAMGLWVRAGAWCGQQLTDGVIPADVARTMGKPSEIAALVRVGFWEKIEPDSYRFHDFLERNPSRAEVEQARDRERDKKAAWRARRAGQEGLSPGDTPVDNPVDTTGDDLGDSPGESRSTRPDPSRPSTTTPRRASRSEVADGFAAFWEAYPRRVAKAAAVKAWAKALKTTPPEQIMAGLAAFRFDTREDGRFIPHPASWLNAQRWADEQPGARPTLAVVGPDGQPTLTKEQVEEILGPEHFYPGLMPEDLERNGTREQWRDWHRDKLREYRAQRVQQALARLAEREARRAVGQ